MTIYFEPYQNGFKFAVMADGIVYPEVSPTAEKIRLDWIEDYVEENGLCPSGYVIAERKVTKSKSTALIGGETSQIFYIGQCT